MDDMGGMGGMGGGMPGMGGGMPGMGGMGGGAGGMDFVSCHPFPTFCVPR